MKIPQRYWDSAAFIGWLTKRPERYDICDQILGEAEAGKVQIVTSTVTFAEVFWIKEPPGLPSNEQVAAIKQLFGKSYVVPAEVDRPTAELARDLLFAFAQSHGLRSMDALHLATAIRIRSRGGAVEAFDTWDGKLSKLNGKLVSIERLQAKDSGADLYIGVPLISPRLPFRRDDEPRRGMRIVGGETPPRDRSK